MTTAPASPTRTPLSPTPRTRVARGRPRARTDRRELHAVLGADAIADATADVPAEVRRRADDLT